MKILFFTSGLEDYLADALFHGFRSQYGADCIDFPKCEPLYKDCPDYIRKQVRGNGFTLYSGLLEDIEVDRFNIARKIKSGYFDLIVISDIWRQYGWFIQFRPWLNSKNTVILDGADTSQPYPAAGLWWRRSYYWFLPKAHKDFLYFKREWLPETHFNILSRLIPQGIRNKLPHEKNLRQIAFSIPSEKIVSQLPLKTKDFPTHIVDAELAKMIPGSHTSYAFNTESEYYKDLQSARFGITTKRSGWDCLRHYEIAANGAVPCFKNLDEKPKNCAPHGLDETNSISYKNASDLQQKINALTEDEYLALQQGAIKWAKQNSTILSVQKIIQEFKNY